MHLGTVDHPIFCVSNHDRMAAKDQVRLGLDQTLGDAISDFFHMLLVDALMHAAVRDETMVFQVEAIEEHFARTSLQGRSWFPGRCLVEVWNAERARTLSALNRSL